MTNVVARFRPSLLHFLPIDIFQRDAISQVDEPTPRNHDDLANHGNTGGVTNAALGSPTLMMVYRRCANGESVQPNNNNVYNPTTTRTAQDDTYDTKITRTAPGRHAWLEDHAYGARATRTAQ